MHSSELAGPPVSVPESLHQLADWLEAQAALARLAAAGASADPGAGASQQQFADAYRRFFPVPDLQPASAPAGAEALRRYQAALLRLNVLLNEAAVDAGGRLAAALAASGPQAPPIRSVRELRVLWIDCGEAAWSTAAHREPFADALAELLAAWSALRAAGQAA